MRSDRRFSPAISACEPRILCDGDPTNLYGPSVLAPWDNGVATGPLPEVGPGPIGGLLDAPDVESLDRTGVGDPALSGVDPAAGDATPHETNPVDYDALIAVMSRPVPVDPIDAYA